MGKGIDIPSYLLGSRNGGGGGTSDYNNLSNKPSINGITLEGAMTSGDLGVPTVTISQTDITPGVTPIPEGTLYFVYE